MEQESAVKHLVWAMALNLKRGVSYGVQSRGRSFLVSIPLIMSEFLCVFVLGLYELWGLWFNRQGINIIQGDFVPMANVNAMGTPLRFNGVASGEVCSKLTSGNALFMRTAGAATFAGDFRKVADLTHECLTEVLALEEETQSLFVMHRHILESLGLAAIHSIRYLDQSHGRTLALSKCFLLTQVYAMGLAIFFDRAAQRCHQMHVGILENDVPYIPFLEAYASFTEGTNEPSGEAE